MDGSDDSPLTANMEVQWWAHLWRDLSRPSREMDGSYRAVTTVSKLATTTDPDSRKKIRSACAEMSSESAKALSDLASSIRNMTSPSAASLHVASALAAAGKLKTAVPQGGAALSDVIRLATTASLLAQVVASTHQIAGAVEELARTAKFRKPEPAEKAAVKPVAEGECPPHVVIDVE